MKCCSRQLAGSRRSSHLSKFGIQRGGRGPLYESRYLISCDENPGMIVVLLGTEIWGMVLLQYDLTTKDVKEEQLWAGALMEKRRHTDGGVLSVHAPNRITLSGSKIASQSWSVVDGKFIGEDGNIFAQDEGFVRAVPTSETLPPTPPLISSRGKAEESAPLASDVKAPAGATPATAPNEKPTLPAISTLWSVIVALIMAALGFLCLLFKRRSLP